MESESAGELDSASSGEGLRLGTSKTCSVKLFGEKLVLEKTAERDAACEGWLGGQGQDWREQAEVYSGERPVEGTCLFRPAREGTSARVRTAEQSGVVRNDYM